MVRPNDKKLSRKERECLWHQELILNAAEALFSRKGYHDTSVEEIAERAEFSVGYLYKIFEGKGDIYRQLIISRGDEYFQEVFARIDKEAGAKAKLQAVLRCKLNFFKKHRQFFRIFANFTADPDTGPPPMISEECQRRYREYQNKLAGIFASVTKEGAAINCDPSLAVLTLEGITNAIIGRWIYTGESELESVDPGVIENILFNGLITQEEG